MLQETNNGVTGVVPDLAGGFMPKMGPSCEPNLSSAQLSRQRSSAVFAPVTAGRVRLARNAVPRLFDRPCKRLSQHARRPRQQQADTRSYLATSLLTC